MVAVIASVTVTLTVKEPDTEGVPLMRPEPSELIDRPAGNPVWVHVYGAVPPVRVICVDVYTTPAWPTGSDAGPTPPRAALIVMPYVFDALVL
jgi:hypothetical protein